MAIGTYGQIPILSQQITAASADETYGPWVDVRGCANITFYCAGLSTTSSGVITFEECAPADLGQPIYVPIGQDVGKYSAITTLNASTISGGVQVAVHISQAAFFYVRARISTVIGGGGTVSVGLVAY